MPAQTEPEFSFEAVLEAAPDALIITGPDGRILRVNARAEELFGYLRSEVVGEPVELLVPARYRARHPQHRQGYVESPRPRPMGDVGGTLAGLRKDGTEFPAEISLSPLPGVGLVGTIVAVRDVTERRKLEEERATLARAQEALRLRDEFLSIASHELRTPVTALQMLADSVERAAAREGTSLPPSLSGKLASIAEATQRLTVLVEQLLDLSCLNDGRLQLQREDVDLSSLVARVSSTLEDEIARAGSTLALRLEPGLRGAWDPLRLEQVLTNLLGNAVKYGQGQPIVVATARGGEGVRLTVLDHGIGIDREDQARIFERFERAVSSRTHGGFGLGLWVARQLVEAHGGRISVSSEPGAGALFTVELPSGLQGADSPAEAAVDRRRLLLVEDDALLRRSFESALTEEGFRVTTAANGLEALRLLRAGAPHPSVIVLDLMMPTMDGPSFRAEQLKDPDLRDVPVVVLSAASDGAERATSLGAAGYLRKPFQLDALLALIGGHCG